MCFSKQKLVVVIIELRMILEFTHIPTKGKKRYMELCCSPALTLCSNSSWTQRKSSLCDCCSCCPPSRWGQQEQANGAALSCPLNSIKNLWKQTTNWWQVYAKSEEVSTGSPIAVCLAFCLQCCQTLTMCMGRHELQVSASKLEWSMFHPALAWCTQMARMNPQSWMHLGTSSTGLSSA